MDSLRSLEQHVGSGPKSRFTPIDSEAASFRFQSAEIGHVHPGGIVDIPFPRPVRDRLVDERLTEEHP